MIIVSFLFLLFLFFTFYFILFLCVGIDWNYFRKNESKKNGMKKINVGEKEPNWKGKRKKKNKQGAFCIWLPNFFFFFFPFLFFLTPHIILEANFKCKRRKKKKIFKFMLLYTWGFLIQSSDLFLQTLLMKPF